MKKVKTADDLPSDFGHIDGEPHPDDVIARAATAAERERCARLAEQTEDYGSDAGDTIAARIRESP